MCKLQDSIPQKSLDFHYMEKKLELRRAGNFASFDSKMKEILQEIPPNKSGLIMLRSRGLVFENDLKDILTESFFHKVRKRIFNSSPRYQKILKHISFLRIMSAIAAVFGTLSDYVLDSQLTITMFVSWQTVRDPDFPFEDYFLDISVFLVIILFLSHTLSTFVLVHMRRFDLETLKCKILYLLSFLCYPAFYVMSFGLFEAKSFHSPPSNLREFLDEKIIRYQYTKSVNEQKIVENCVENIPQLILLILFTMSVPLVTKFRKVKPAFGIIFFGFKAAVQYLFFSLTRIT